MQKVISQHYLTVMLIKRLTSQIIFIVFIILRQWTLGFY